MELTYNPQYIGATVTVTTNISVQICSKLKIVSFFNRQCAAMLAAPIMGHDVIFTQFVVDSFGLIFHS